MTVWCLRWCSGIGERGWFSYSTYSVAHLEAWRQLNQNLLSFFIHGGTISTMILRFCHEVFGLWLMNNSSRWMSSCWRASDWVSALLNMHYAYHVVEDNIIGSLWHPLLDFLTSFPIAWDVLFELNLKWKVLDSNGTWWIKRRVGILYYIRLTFWWRPCVSC